MVRTGSRSYAQEAFRLVMAGRFEMPDTIEKNVRLEATEIAMLLSGMDLNRARLKRWKPQRQRSTTAPDREPRCRVAEHECEYKEAVDELEAMLAKQHAMLLRMQAELGQLKKSVIGPQPE